ncbi:hypothetical protein B0F90DRAFT_1219091 [Multifurca ochricompacta]|uniref:Uncharacterized protein n=1 Tax=Multifurca ochricompacta TaxID=376703 RepID=A0AAD4M0C3_9AGAM|nr:hypothetical protein B0F90DRAFT_1219091 [Multifurca ochricompacta]
MRVYHMGFFLTLRGEGGVLLICSTVTSPLSPPSKIYFGHNKYNKIGFGSPQSPNFSSPPLPPLASSSGVWLICQTSSRVTQESRFYTPFPRSSDSDSVSLVVMRENPCLRTRRVWRWEHTPLVANGADKFSEDISWNGPKYFTRLKRPFFPFKP